MQSPLAGVCLRVTIKRTSSMTILLGTCVACILMMQAEHAAVCRTMWHASHACTGSHQTGPNMIGARSTAHCSDAPHMVITAAQIIAQAVHLPEDARHSSLALHQPSERPRIRC